MVSALIIPACIALLIKVAILFSAYGDNNRSSVFTAMLGVFACHNVCEILAYLQFFHGATAPWLVRCYYAISVFAMLYMSFYALEVSKRPLSKQVTTVLAVVAVVFTLLIVTGDTIVTGSRSMGYTLTALHGDFYWLYQLLVVASMGSIIVILSMGYVRSNDSLTERQCLYTLLALLPLLLAGPTVLLLQHLGWQINTSLILPITSTFYLLVIVASEKVHRLTDIRAYLPFSAERKISRALFKTCTDYSSQQCSLKEAQNNCERILLLYSLEKNNYNVSKTAEMINVKRTTLYSICQRLDIPISGKR